MFARSPHFCHVSSLADAVVGLLPSHLHWQVYTPGQTTLQPLESIHSFIVTPSPPYQGLR